MLYYIEYLYIYIYIYIYIHMSYEHILGGATPRGGRR